MQVKTSPHIIHAISALLLFLSLLAGTASASEKQAHIAVAAESTEVTSQISTVAARAPYFLIFDKQNNLLETVINPVADVSGGAGPKAATFLSEKKISLVIAGHFGGKMTAALTPHKILTVERQGRVIDAVKEQNHAQE